MGQTSQRKKDHLRLCATEDVLFKNKTTLLEEVELIHEALPDLCLSEIDTSISLFGKTLKYPLIIEAMTGGTEEAEHINKDLAKIAEDFNIGFGLGSQRAMVEKNELKSTFFVRNVAPKTLILGNIGFVQATMLTKEQLDYIVNEPKIDCLCIHLNSAMELVQPEGDTDFKDGSNTIKRLVEQLNVPVIVKETGCGISNATAARLKNLGVKHIDVAGAGGTSWVKVETLRSVSDSKIGQAFIDWGIPTAASILHVKPVGFDTIIASGGLITGLDVVKSLVLGADAAGIARMILKIYWEFGTGAVKKYLNDLIQTLKIAMVLVGARNISELKTKKYIIGDKLKQYSQF